MTTFLLICSGVSEFILELLRILLSAPSVSLIVAAVLLYFFRNDIKGLLERIGTIRVPGGGELVLSQSQQNAKEPETEKSPTSIPSDNRIELPKGLTLSDEEFRAIDNLLQSERINARLWEYQYLNYHLVISTQHVLDFIAACPNGEGENLLDTRLRPFIASSAERNAILATLESHYLIVNANGIIAATPKGREYIEFRGPIPVPDVPPSGLAKLE